MPDLKPHEQVARQFMEHKGYKDIEPTDVQKLDDEPCWYFVYLLREGTLELEVFWDGREWQTLVTTFELREDGPG